jgi:hypothetical protein
MTQIKNIIIKYKLSIIITACLTIWVSIIIHYLYKLRTGEPHEMVDTFKIFRKRYPKSTHYYYYCYRTALKINYLKNKVNNVNNSLLCIQGDNRIDSDFVKKSIKINQYFCKKKGFSYYFDDYSNYSNYNSGIKLYNNKIILLYNLIKTNNTHDYLMWIDSDAVLLESFNFNKIIGNYPNKNIIISKDPYWSKPGLYKKFFYPIACSGVFIIKNDKTSLEIFEYMIDNLTNKKRIDYFKKLHPNTVTSWAGYTYDQGQINLILRKYYIHSVLLAQKYLNGSATMDKNIIDENWVMHAMGTKSEKRAELFDNLIEYYNIPN